jgi:hypothetical protein
MTTAQTENSAIVSTLSKTAVMLSSTTSIIVIILTLLWVVSDANTRFTNQAIADKQPTKSVNIVPLNLPKLNADIVSQLKTQYQAYKEQNLSDKKNDAIGMSAAEQAKQQGELTRFFINDNKVELKAIINNAAFKDLTALIMITNINTGDKTLDKYQHLSELQGYQVAIDKNTQVTLTKNRAQGLQKVILTMYTKYAKYSSDKKSE